MYWLVFFSFSRVLAAKARRIAKEITKVCPLLTFYLRLYTLYVRAPACISALGCAYTHAKGAWQGEWSVCLLNSLRREWIIDEKKNLSEMDTEILLFFRAFCFSSLLFQQTFWHCQQRFIRNNFLCKTKLIVFNEWPRSFFHFLKSRMDVTEGKKGV